MLEVKDLHTTKGTFQLDVEHFHMKEGELTLVLGPNGGGKTTFLQTLAGLLNYNGSVFVDDCILDNIGFKDRARVFGYLPQNIYFNELLVRDFLILGRFPHTNIFSRYSKFDWENVYRVAGDFNLEDYLERNLVTLSQGELQRVLLAKVFVQEARVLLLDEPTTALDIGFKKRIKEQIYRYLEIRPDSMVVIATHEPDIFMDRCSNILMLKTGKRFSFGTKDRVYSETKISDLFDLSIFP